MGPPASHQRVAVVLLDGIQARYGIGRTKACELVKDPGFPNSVVAGMHCSLAAALEAYEFAAAAAAAAAAAVPAGTVADPARLLAGGPSSPRWAHRGAPDSSGFKTPTEAPGVLSLRGWPR